MQFFQINQSEEISKITINAHTTSFPLYQLPITTASTLPITPLLASLMVVWLDMVIMLSLCVVQGVDLVYSVPGLVVIIDKLARYLYDMNIAESEVQPQGYCTVLYCTVLYRRSSPRASTTSPASTSAACATPWRCRTSSSGTRASACGAPTTRCSARF